MRDKIRIGVLLVLFMSCNVYSQTTERKVQKLFTKNIKIVENFYKNKGGYSLELKSASIFLTKLTNIKPNALYSYEGLGTLSASDVTDWKNWYTKNKHVLYWDDKSKSIRISSQLIAKS
ncbi:MAG: hypothetical protein HRT69_06955 [Flavobacteriaceae bacterium]|nr:hypothetical protein [Flavobacteriaceae bacterium]